MKIAISLFMSALLLCYLPALATPGMPHHHAMHHMGHHMKHKKHHKGTHHKKKAVDNTTTAPTSTQ